jgi:putative redox protein
MTTDKSKTVTASIRLLNEKLHFEGKVDGNEPISIDYTPPLGDNLGYTSLELLLLSLSSCVGSAMLVVLRKMQKQVQNLKIVSKGIRRQEHPTGFESISLEILVQSGNISLDDMEKVTHLIEGLCPVISMVKGNVVISYSFTINQEETKVLHKS